MKYGVIPELSVDAVEAAIRRDEPQELVFAVLSAALYASSPEWAAEVCRKLATHEHFNVRGNAILGFAHIARIHGRLDQSVVLPIIEAGLADSHEYVRSQAHGAADDVEHFLGWSIDRPREA